MCTRRVVDAFDNKIPVNVNLHNFSKHHPRFCWLAKRTLQLDDLTNEAFERDRALLDAQGANANASSLLETGEHEFVDLVRDACRAGVHCWRVLAGRKVPDELARLRDVRDSILPTVAAEADDIGFVAEGVEEAVRSQIGPTVPVAGGNPADRARFHNRIERIMA